MAAPIVSAFRSEIGAAFRAVGSRSEFSAPVVAPLLANAMSACRALRVDPMIAAVYA